MVETILCTICSSNAAETTEGLCEKCQAMDFHLDHLIANDAQHIREYLKLKIAAFSDRRVKQVLYSPLRRKTDIKKQ